MRMSKHVICASSKTEEADYRTLAWVTKRSKWAISWGLGKELDDIWIGKNNPKKKPIWWGLNHFAKGSAWSVYLGRHAFAFYKGVK